MTKATSLALALCATAFSLCGADLTIVYKNKSKGFGMKQESVVTHHYTAQFHKSVDTENQEDSLVDYEKGIVYTLKHKDKKIEKATFEDLMAAAENAKKQMENMGEVPAFLKGMLGATSGSVKVEKLGTDTVAGRACKRYRLSLGKTQHEVSMDESISIPVDAKAYARHLRLKTFAVPGMADLSKIYEELAKLKGIALRNKMKGVMGMDIELEATDISQKAIPPSTFALPASYTIEDVGKKLRGRED